jgi:hypothetical protein
MSDRLDQPDEDKEACLQEIRVLLNEFGDPWRATGCLEDFSARVFEVVEEFLLRTRRL